MKFYVKNKFVSFRGDSVVYDEEKNNLYKIKGKLFSLSNKKKIINKEGEILYYVKNKLINFFTRTSYVLNSDKQKLAKVKNRMFKSGFDVIGYKDIIKIDGFSLSGYSIIKNDEKIGTVKRPIISVTDEFEVDLNEGEDMAFIVALVIAIDNVVDNIKKN